MSERTLDIIIIIIIQHRRRRVVGVVESVYPRAVTRTRIPVFVGIIIMVYIINCIKGTREGFGRSR